MTIKIKLKPFKIPSEVCEDIDASKFKGEPRIYALSDLDPVCLSELCDQFRRDIFKKAGLPDPSKTAIRSLDNILPFSISRDSA